MALDKPVFIDNDPNVIVSESVDYYEQLVDRKLQPAQPERMLVNSNAYREGLLRGGIQDAAVLNLVAFSVAPILDYLAELVGVVRLASGPASCTLRFILIGGHAGVSIPAGTRVSSSDGIITFETLEIGVVPAGVTQFDVEAEASEDGIIGNGFVPGEIATLIDPQAFIVSVSNIEETGGGSEQESDESMRERIRLAPASFSVAGPTGAYKFWAATANSNIIDVEVNSPSPGVVAIYPLMSDGEETPIQVLGAVYETCNDDNIRPLTDTVETYSPHRIDYTLKVNLTLYNGEDPDLIKPVVESNLDIFTTQKRLKMGQDIVLRQLFQECIVDGVYDVEILDENDDPFDTIVVPREQFAFCVSFLVSVVGYNVG